MTPGVTGEAPSAGDGARGTLFVVATPIGNLGDVTLRALEVLRSVPLVAAEDTRLTRRLWARHGISTRLVSFHAHSPGPRLEALLEHLARGEDLALVTDAGTPLVSDPGADLVAAWVERGGRVVPIPGASAVLAALVASGIPAARWSFEGFLPRRGAERRERLERAAADERATVLFESPERVAATFRDLVQALGGTRRASLSRELTKLHEETWRGSLDELASRVSTSPPRGEVTIVVAGREPAAGAPPAAESDRDRLRAAAARVSELVDQGARRADAARLVARETGLPRRALFTAREHDGVAAAAPDDAPGEGGEG